MENLPLKLKKVLTQSSTISTSLPGPSSFLQDAASLYELCPEFRDSLIVSLLKASINRTMGNGSELFDEKVINFYRFVQTFSPRANLRGPGECWVRRLNNSEVQDCIFNVTHDVLVARTKKVAAASAVGPCVPVTFSLVIDATKVAKLLEVSASHKAIIGDAFPNHVFDISYLPKDDVNNVIAGTSESVNINKSMEVKVEVMSF